MTTLAEIESAVSNLPQQQKYELFRFLAKELESPGSQTPASARRSVLDIVPVSLGAVLGPLDDNDDLLGEMLEEEG